jgi:hypothetical protein
MKLDEIGLGDVVRLRNGETLRVGAKVLSYEDSTGKHDGPFVASGTAALDRYVLSDIVEVVERNPRRCRYCGEGVTSTKPEIEYCSNCFYTGAAYEDRHSDLMTALADLDPVRDVGVWHMGGGCFLLAVKFADGRLVTVTDAGGDGIPEMGETWGLLVVSPNEETFDAWDDDRMDIRNGSWTNEQLVAEIRTISTEPVRV